MEFFYFTFSLWCGDVPRLLIHLGGLDVQDHKISREEYKRMKLQKGILPFGSLPVLKVGTTKLSHPMAIVKFLAKKAGMYPTDPMEAAKVDEVLLLLNGITNVIEEMLYLDEEERRVLFRLFLQSNKASKMIDDLIGGNEWVVGDDLTVADLMVWHVYQWFEAGNIKEIPKMAFHKFKNIQRLRKNVEGDESVSDWMEMQ